MHDDPQEQEVVTGSRLDISRVQIRQLGPDWEKALADFFTALRRAGDDRYFHPHALTSEAARERACYTGADFYCIACSGAEVVGYGLLRGWDEGFLIPSLGIAVHPAARRTGLSKVLMGFLHRAAQRKGASRIRLKVYAENIAAVRLYQSLGYVIEREEAGQLIGYLDLQHA